MVARWVGWALVSAGLGAACAGRSTDGVDGEQGSGGTLARGGSGSAGGSGATGSGAVGGNGSGGSSTGGAAGRTDGGEDAGTGGDPLDQLNPACWVFCRTWEGACPDQAPLNSVCAEDCIASSTVVPPDCVTAVARYLRCAGTPDDCSDRTTTPAACTTEESVMVACLLGPVPDGCLRGTPTTGYDSCELETFCGTDGNYVVRCDAAGDGTGTSLCDCSIDATYVDTVLVPGMGAVACARSAIGCGPS
jgi:hypothetical protein